MERCFRNHYFKFGWHLTPSEPKKVIFLTCQTGGHIVYDIIRKIPCTGNYDLKISKTDWLLLSYTTIPLYGSVSLYQIWMGTNPSRAEKFSAPVKLAAILSMMSLGKPSWLWLTYLPILTLQYWFSSDLAQNHLGKRIIITGPECIDLLAYMEVLVVDRGSTPYPSPSELCSQIHRHLWHCRLVGG